MADEQPPFIDATGAHAGALLGDVKHDPFQSGGLETPAHERLEVGAIHKANKGVLFIDEINMLRIESQQSLLTALQEGEFAIIGQSERSSGAMVKSEPVPCDFILVAAGNLDAVSGMHPALRSRIRGYGYEIFMRSTMPDTDANREKLIRFVAQEVSKDKKIPHFDKGAVSEIIREAQRRSGRRGMLTLRLRELGGLVRVAGDIARERAADIVDAIHVTDAKKIARSLEQQVTDRAVERRKDYKTCLTEGSIIGIVNGLAVLNAESSMSEYSGIVTPIVAEVTPAHTREGGKIIATGKLGEIAKESVQNVSALIKKYTGEDISNHDVHVQFIGTYDGIEGDSASISVATAVISAFEEIEVDQTVAMTGQPQREGPGASGRRRDSQDRGGGRDGPQEGAHPRAEHEGRAAGGQVPSEDSGRARAHIQRRTRACTRRRAQRGPARQACPPRREQEDPTGPGRGEGVGEPGIGGCSHAWSGDRAFPALPQGTPFRHTGGSGRMR